MRLSPPADVIAPTILLARSALCSFNPNRCVLDRFTALPASVTVKGQVTEDGTPTPAAASVTLVATKITGAVPGVLASFVRQVDVGSDGHFEQPLLPGTYRVTAVPGESLDEATGRGLAAVTEEWVVVGEPRMQAGKVVALGRTLPINGQAFSGSTPLAAADVLAVASPASVRSNVLQQALGATEFVPRASTGTVEERTGNFALNSDLGSFDITVRPLSSTRFGWLVIPSIIVAQASAGQSLSRQEAPLPVAYRGAVTAPATPESRNVPDALIRAYVYMSGGE